MKSKYLLYLGVAVAVAIAAVAAVKYSSQSPQMSPTPSGTVCTLEVKLCPNGSYVGRVGPRCDFAPCPTSTPRPSSGY